MRLLLLLAPAAIVAACAGPESSPYAQAWSLVEAADPSDVRKEFSPAITEIDGVSTRNTRRPEPVAPGKHKVTIRYETARVTQSPDEETRTLDLDMAPCTRYRVAAQRTEGTQWKPVVYPEKIGECERKFK